MITLPPAQALQAKHLLSAQKESSDRLFAACHLKGMGENFVSGEQVFTQDHSRDAERCFKWVSHPPSSSRGTRADSGKGSVAGDSGLHNIMKPL